MQVFISWSQERSKAIAEALHWWLPMVINAVQPWVSNRDIDAGTPWFSEIEQHLQESDAGIVCCTPESVGRPWVLFESGALAAKFGKAKVIPFLYGMKPTDLTGPLSQIQQAEANQEGVLKLVLSLNRLQETPIPPDRLAESVAVWWPKLEERLAAVPAAPTAEAAEPKRSVEDMVEELLRLARRSAAT